LKIDDEDGMLMKEEDEEMGKILATDCMLLYTKDLRDPMILFFKNKSNDLN